jgi:beta-lactamase regulating signal transducer with metallopeptidase domain
MIDSLPIPVAYALDGLLAGTFLLTIGFIVAALTKQSINRLRALEITLGCTLLAACVALLPGLPGWTFMDSITESSVAQSANEVVQVGPLRATDGQLLSGDNSNASAATGVGRINSATTNVSDIQPIDQVALMDVLSTLATIAAWIYVVGLLAIVGWWLVGIAMLAQIVRRSRNASENFQAIMQTLAGKTHRVRIVVSERVRQPIAFRLGERVIVIPERLSEETNTDNIHHVLAHEWSHIERGDWWTWLLANIVRAVFFFHPAAWWIRQQVRLTQDFVADARAADQAKSKLDYAEFLTRQAAVSRQPVLAVGLGMRGRRSELYRRVVSLVKGAGPIDTECTHARTLALFLPTFALAIACGSMNVFSDRSAVAAQTEPSFVIDHAAIAANQSRFDFDVLTEGELQVQFEDDEESLCFQLTAVGDVAQGQPRWWEPDGKLLSTSPQQMSDSRFPNSQNDVGRAFLLHMWKNDRVSVRWRIPDTETRCIHDESIRIGDRHLTTTVLASHWSNDQLPKSAKMWVGYAAGPWTDFETHPHPDSPIKLTRRNKRGVIDLNLNGPLNDYEIKITATDRHGHEQEIIVDSKYGQDQASISLPGLDERNIDCLQLSVRRFKWILFEDISLQAHQSSQPRAIRPNVGAE